MSAQHSESLGELGRFGKKLIANGYAITPIRPGTKRPTLENWSTTVIDHDRLAGLLAGGASAAGVGILTGRLRAVDIDVLDKVVAQEMEEAAVKYLGATLVRTGRAPKRLMVYRAADAPIPKRQSAAWQDRSGRTHRVEILGVGQQFVAFGVHPDTQLPYTWAGGDPTTVALDDLPAITVEQVDAFLEECADVFDWHGYECLGNATGIATVAGPGGPIVDDPFVAIPKTGITVDDVRAALGKIDADDREVWLRVGAALHHQFGDEGRELWDDWSQGSPEKFDPRDQEKTWSGFRSARGRVATILSVFEMAGVKTPRGSVASVSSQLREELQNPTPVVFSHADALPGAFWSDVSPEGEPARELIEGLLGIHQASLVAAGTNVGKSMLAIDIAVAVASGEAWRSEHQVAQGPVLYVAAESPGSIRSRALAVKAYAKTRGRDVGDLPIFITDAPIDIRADGGKKFRAQMAATFQEMKARLGAEPVLVVVDTLAMSAPGIAENDADEMGGLSALVQRMSRDTGQAHWMILHHLGKDADRGARGHSSLPAAVDTEIRLAFDPITRLVAGTVTKQRELPTRGFAFWFRIEGVPTGRTTNFGNPETQPVVVHEDNPASNASSDDMAFRGRVLAAVVRDPGITTATVGSMRGQSVQAGKRILDSLLDDRLVVRVRRGHLEITPAGRQFLDALAVVEGDCPF